LEDSLERALADLAFPTQRQGALQTSNQRREILVVSPGRKRDGLEAAHELIVGSERVAGLLSADAHERDAQLVAQEPQHAQEARLLADRARLQTMHLVDDQ